MLSKFNNEVLSKGPDAVLPQNLSREWLNTLHNIAEDFLDINFSLDECGDLQEIADPILATCVYEIVRHQYGDTSSVSTEEILEKMAIYAISISMEAVNRESDIGLDLPNLDNILSIDRVIAFKEINPDFIKLLEQACVIRDSS
ncbi:hypothetical protein ACFL03_13450 [Thermodesulfobacteriota bacterium]